MKRSRSRRTRQAVGSLGRVLHAWELWDAARAGLPSARRRSLREPSNGRTRTVSSCSGLDVIRKAAERPEGGAGLVAGFSANARQDPVDALFDAREIARRQRPSMRSLVKIPASEPMGHFGLGRVAAIGGPARCRHRAPRARHRVRVPSGVPRTTPLQPPRIAQPGRLEDEERRARAAPSSTVLAGQRSKTIDPRRQSPALRDDDCPGPRV